MQEFRKFLDEQKTAFTEADLAENGDWIKSSIKAELFINEFGQQEGMTRLEFLRTCMLDQKS